MSAAEKKVTLWALETEAAAVVADLAHRPPRKDFEEIRPLAVRDIRESHLSLVRGAIAAVQRLSTD